MTTKRILQSVFLLVLIIGTYFILRSRQNMPFHKNFGRVFGTEYHITYQNDKDIQKEIEEQLNQIDASFSMFNPTSTISLINQNKSFKTDKLLENVLPLALQVSKNTFGAFDVTVAPLVNLWGFGFKNASNITPDTIQQVMQYVGYQKIEFIRHQIKKQNKNTMIDFSAIAKGYACDYIASLMQRKHIDNYMIEIGGEIRAKGKNEKNKVWNIGISQPTDDSTHIFSNAIITTIQLSDIGMATSGNYRNFYYKNGKKYAHTINPRTGYPIQHSLLSATVIAPSCAEADAYATAFMVLGLDSAKIVLDKQKQLKAFLIYSNQKGELETWKNFTTN